MRFSQGDRAHNLKYIFLLFIIVSTSSLFIASCLWLLPARLCWRIVSQRLDVVFRILRRKWNLTVFLGCFDSLLNSDCFAQCSMKETAHWLAPLFSWWIEMNFAWNRQILFKRIWKLVARDEKNGRRLRNIPTNQNLLRGSPINPFLENSLICLKMCN